MAKPTSPDGAGNGGPAPGGGGFGWFSAILKTLTGALAVIGILLLIIVAVAYIQRPRGETYLAFHSQIDTEQRRMLREMFAAVAVHSEDALNLHAEISRHLSGDDVQALSPPDFREMSRLDEALTQFVAVGDVPLDPSQDGKDSFVFRVALNLKTIIESIYQELEIHDYPVTVTSVGDVPCADPDEEGCMRVVLDYAFPESEGDAVQSSTTRARSEDKRLTDYLTGTPAQIEKDFGVFILRTQAIPRGTAWKKATLNDKDAQPPFLLDENIPRALDQLDATNKALAKLGEDCPAGYNVSQCVEEARGWLEVALPKEDGRPRAQLDNPAASFALALVRLHEARIAAQGGAPTYAIERKLAEMTWSLRDARQSKYIEAALSEARDAEGLDHFGALFGDGELNSDLLIDPKAQGGEAPANLICALAHYRWAIWDKCLEQIPDPAILPKPIRAYFEAASYDTRLIQSKAAGTPVDALMSELDDRIRDYHAAYSAPLRLVRLRHSCNGPDSVDQMRSQKTDMLAELPAAPSRWLVMVDLEIAACGAGDLSEQELQRILRMDSWQPGEIEQKLLYLEVARLRARLGDVDGSIAAAQSAMALPWAFHWIKGHPDFAQVSANHESLNQLYLASFADRKGDLEVCQNIERGGGDG